MPRIRLITLALAAVSVGACAHQFNEAEETQKLLKRDADWSALASAGKDTDGVAAFWSEDALFSMEGVPEMRGRPTIRQFVAQSFRTPGFNIHWTSKSVTFSPDGKLAYMPFLSETKAPDASGAITLTAGRGIEIWRLDGDGVWRCVVDFTNDLPMASAAPAPTPR